MAVYIHTGVDAQTRKYALLGARLPYTLSPQIQNTLFAARGANALYVPLCVPAASLASAVDVLRHDFAGFNVTVPYKEAVVPFLDELDAAASACGAVNTVTVGEDGALTGHITDGLGMMRALEEAWVELRGIDALIVGGGGTARVAAYELLRRESRVTLAVRTPHKAHALRDDLAALQDDGDARIRILPLDALAEAGEAYDLLVHCTPLGTFPETDACAVPVPVIGRCRAVFDAVYNPPESLLLSRARQAGAKCVNGFGMLFYQAVEAQRLWLGGAPPTRVLREARRALEALV